MPSSDVDAKAWQLDLSGSVGKAVRRRRKVIKLSAQQLAKRTAELGYPVSRVAISKIEANVRGGKLDVAEWLALSQALEIPPALLLFPDYPEGPVQGLPGREDESVNAVRWISGTRARSKAPGVDLVELVEQRADVMWELNRLDRLWFEQMPVRPKAARDETEKVVKRQIQMNERQLEILEADIQRVKGELWGTEEVGSDE